MARELTWLPADPDWPARVKALDMLAEPAARWDALVALANARIDFIRTNRLDSALRKHFAAAPPAHLTTRPIRLAVLAASTVAHLLPAIRVAALRRNLWLTTYEPDYGQYLQELLNPDSGLCLFRPSAVLVALDGRHLFGAVDAAADADQGDAALDEALGRLEEIWRLAKDRLGAAVIQQTVLNAFPKLLGENEHRLPGSRHHLVERLNQALRRAAADGTPDLLTFDRHAAEDGLAAWHDPMLWHHAKQEISPAAAPVYGDLVGRLLAARQGLSRKALVLDLDNTLWGGVIGDDGLEGIVIGQGSAAGEAFVDFQSYARELAKRGVILAVCSKNDEANALEPFEKHPDMVLKRSDIAAFVANWQDKASNIRSIARQLNIGLDALVFVDDNPFERNLVRQELPMVAVPEMPEDVALYAKTVADAGYFEAIAITDDDRERTRQYTLNEARESLRAQATDLVAYLDALQMKLIWGRFDPVNLPRIVQLINKTNQFNLMTRRYTQDEVVAVMDDPAAFGLHLRLTDRFGDNGIIAIVIGRRAGGGDIVIDTWLMSCRVLGRQVEEATLNLVAAEARRLGGERLIGEYRPTAKNAMVKEHYVKLGFTPQSDGGDGVSRAGLDLTRFEPVPTRIEARFVATPAA